MPDFYDPDDQEQQERLAQLRRLNQGIPAPPPADGSAGAVPPPPIADTVAPPPPKPPAPPPPPMPQPMPTPPPTAAPAPPPMPPPAQAQQVGPPQAPPLPQPPPIPKVSKARSILGGLASMVVPHQVAEQISLPGSYIQARNQYRQNTEAAANAAAIQDKLADATWKNSHAQSILYEMRKKGATPQEQYDSLMQIPDMKPEDAKRMVLGGKPPEQPTEFKPGAGYRNPQTNQVEIPVPAPEPAPTVVPQGGTAINRSGKVVATGSPKELAAKDRAISIYAKPISERTPEEAAFIRGYEKDTDVTKTQPGVLRIEALGETRGVPMLDTEHGNAPVLLNWNEINKGNREEPGRYLPAGTSTQALNKTALLEDIRGNVKQVRNSLAQMPEFDTWDKAKIALALRSRDPRGSMNALLSGAAAGSMTPQQQDYLITVTNLIENAMAMRSVLGAGQGSEDLRSAIMATIPGPATPNRAYAMQQLDVFERVLNRLEAGVPKVPLRTDTGGGAQKPGGAKPDPLGIR